MPRAHLQSINFVILMLICVGLASACKMHSTNTASIEQIASKELGPGYTINFNSSKTFALCKQNRINDHINSIFNYCVISVSENKIIHKGSYQQGSVLWIDNNNIEVNTTNKFSTEPTRKIISINLSQQ